MLVFGCRQAVQVSGNSMYPTLSDGDIVLVKPIRKPLVGDVVLVQHPYKKSVKIIKRVAADADNGQYELRGDNPDESTDSRTFGSVPLKYILGAAVCLLK